MLLSLISGVSLAGCARLSVNIDRQPPKIERQLLDKKAAQKLVTEEGREAHTDWVFALKSDLGFHVESKDTSPHYSKVEVRITRVNLVLSLPIVIWTAADASPLVLAHEDGHVQICKRVYDDAERLARLSADGVIGKVYRGQGDTLEEACQQALSKAAEDLHEDYQRQTLELANRVSEAYDNLCDGVPEERQVPAELVEKAFEQDSQNAPQRLK